MPYSKRRIIEVCFNLNERIEPHPAVVLSVEDVFNSERFYLCALISTTDRNDHFSFKLVEEDTTKPLKKGSQVRTHMIFQVYEEDISKTTPINFLKNEPFERLIDFIAENVFEVPFEF